MLQLILHGIGDYFFQTDHDALNKKKAGGHGLICCLRHCLTYSLPFLLIGSPAAVGIIFATHFIIDRTNIIAYLIAMKNGTTKELPPSAYRSRNTAYDISNFGFAPERPFAISIWLYIICDNLTHIICNYLALKYF
jgi:hypothetical protein